MDQPQGDAAARKITSGSKDRRPGARHTPPANLTARLLRLEALEDRSLLSATWMNLTNVEPTESAQMSLMLPNGDALVHAATGSGSTGSAVWYLLKPDATGGYQNATWSQTGSMNVARLYFGSAVLPNGNVFAVGGEYASDESDSNSAEIYNLTTGLWTSVSPDPQSHVGDEPTEVLPNGSVLVGNISNNGTEIYNPTTNTWSAGGSKIRSNEDSDEESWVKLPNGDILTYDIYSSISDNQFEAELYNPTTNTWSDASNATSTLPLLSTAALGYELGAAVMLPNGNALFTGANGDTAYYNTTTGLWSAGPTMPVVTINSEPTQLTMGDAPAAVLPDGDVLMALSPAVTVVSGHETFPPPTYIYDLNPTTGVYTNVTPPANVYTQLSYVNSYETSMLVLPTGQILFDDFTASPVLYTPSGSPNPSWLPQITSFVNNGNGSYTLTGTQLNGLDEGAAYGDDEQMATNFPIVQVTDTLNGKVYYATTSNWSSVGVATGSTPETVNVVLPAALGTDPFRLVTIANGISSAPIAAPVVTPSGTTGTFTLGGAAVAIDSGLAVTSSAPGLTGTTVTIANYQFGDTLNFTPQNGITVASNSAGVLSLTGSATPAQYAAALQSVTFSTTSTNTTTRTVNFVATDAGLASNTGVDTVNVAIGPPVVTANQPSVNDTAGQTVSVDSAVTVQSFDTDVTGATMTIGTGYQPGNDTLNFTNQNGITGNYSAGVLTLTGSATPAQYQAALQSITFSSTSTSTTTRNISIVVSDSGDTGNVSSNTATTQIVVSPPVTVAGVYVSGSAWASSFDTYLANKNLGSATYGYALQTGSSQLTTLPWTNINQIDVQFSGPVSGIAQSSLALAGGANGSTPTVTGFAILGNNTYQWTLSGPLTNNRYVIGVASTSSSFGPAVVDSNGAGISGTFTTGQAFPSGNGLAGPTFDFFFDVLPGDTDRNANDNATDINNIRPLSSGTRTTSASYNPYYDLLGTAIINATTLNTVRPLTGRLESANPTAPSDSQQVGTTNFVGLELGVQETGSPTPLATGSSTSSSQAGAVSNAVSAGTPSAAATSTTDSTTPDSDLSRSKLAAIDAALSDFDLADLLV